MTVSATPRVAGPYNGNDAATVFAYTFKVYAKADLRIVLTDADGIEAVAVLDSEYSVALNADQESAPGGTVAYPLVGSPLATGHKLTIVGDTAATQPLDVTNQGGFYPQVIEDALDRTTILAQENRDELTRCVKVPVSSTVDPDQLVNDIVASEAATAASAAASQASADASAASAGASATSAGDSATSEAASLASAGASAASAAASLVSADNSAASAGTAAADAAAGASAAVAASVAAAAGSADDAANSAAESAVSAVASAAVSAPFKNKIINGAFAIAQRGTSQTANGYGSVDRWEVDANGSTKTVSQQAFTLGQTDVPGNPSHYLRAVVSSVAGASNYTVFRHKVEDTRTFQATPSVLSFRAKADSAKNIAIEFIQSFGSGGSAEVNTIGVATVALTTSWQWFSIPVTPPSIAGKTVGAGSFIRAQFWLEAGSTYNARTNSLGQQSGTFEFANMQWEAGTVATEFEPRSIGIERILCTRYYLKILGKSATPNTTRAAILTTIFPVAMRVPPTVTHDFTLANFSNGTPPGANQWGILETNIAYRGATYNNSFVSLISEYMCVLTIFFSTVISGPINLVSGNDMYVMLDAEL